MKLEDEIRQKSFKSESQKLAINILYTGSWVNAIAIKRLRPHRITPQQYNILRILRGQHPKPVGGIQIKERMLDKMSNISRLIEKLRVKGLVDRQGCLKDRRAIDVTITLKGIALLDILDESENQWEKQFLSLSAEEQKTLNNFLDKLRG